MRATVGFILASAGVLALAACGNAGDAREGVRAVGSSTVYPFAVAVAEALARSHPELDAAFVESTGTSEGIVQFCAGAGVSTPDIVNASRRMTKAEFDACKANGVGEIIELQIGLDGIVFASARDGGIEMPLTAETIYRALAANPHGDPQTATTWSAIGRALPAAPIEVFGPPVTSGTRDVLRELVLKEGCRRDERTKLLEQSAPDRFERVCTDLRTDGAYAEQGERDDETVGKLAGNSGALAIFGYSYFEENTDTVKAMSVDGVAPTYETIANGQYPAARPIYIYVKAAHLDLVAGLRPYLGQWAENWGEDGLLTGIGLIAASKRAQAANLRAIENLEPMNAALLR